MRTLNNQTMTARDLTLDSASRWVLGPRLILERCHIVLKGATRRTLQLSDVRLVDGTIEVTTELKDFSDWKSPSARS